MFRHTKLILLLCAFIFLGYARSFAVVPYPEATAAAPEAQIAPPQINDLQDRFQKHEQEQIQSLKEMKNALSQVQERQAMIARDNILLKRICFIFFFSNLILIVLLLKFMWEKTQGKFCRKEK